MHICASLSKKNDADEELMRGQLMLLHYFSIVLACVCMLLNNSQTNEESLIL